jgi:Predicted glycosylase
MQLKHNIIPRIHFTRIDGTPLIEPDPSLAWEAGGVFAPAVIHENGVWKMLYRAYGEDMISRLGYAESDDGIEWKKDKKPRVIPDNTNLEYSGIEDPRIVNIDGRYLITYTAFTLKIRYIRTRIRILETTNFHDFKRITPSFRNHWRKNDKDGVLFPKKIDGLYCMLHRLEPNIQFSSSKDLRRWTRHTTVLRPSEHEWESRKIGAGAPPIKTPIGWLIFYHGVSNTGRYSMSAAILGGHSPTKVLYRLPFPLLSPDTAYEEKGAVPNVVFGTSVIELVSNYCLYYGAGDKVIAAALINKSALLKTLLQYPVNTETNN